MTILYAKLNGVGNNKTENPLKPSKMTAIYQMAAKIYIVINYRFLIFDIIYLEIQFNIFNLNKIRLTRRYHSAS